jgi:hypothetical protein
VGAWSVWASGAWVRIETKIKRKRKIKRPVNGRLAFEE